MTLAEAPFEPVWRPPTGIVQIERASSIPDHVRDWTPKTDLGFAILRSLRYLPRDLQLELVDRISSVAILESSLRATVLRGYGLARQGLISMREVLVEEHGVVSRRVVTDVGVGYIVDAFENLVELENMKFHGIGTGSTAEAAGDTALVTELTTEYNPNSTRATGTTAETASNIFQSVGTNTLDSGTPALREHGLFSAASGGVLFDRSLFAAINLTAAPTATRCRPTTA
jgi:hypothetical protein